MRSAIPDAHLREGYRWAVIDHPAVDEFALGYDEAAKKVAGDDVIECGSIPKLAA
jgi:hypothetical protein